MGMNASSDERDMEHTSDGMKNAGRIAEHGRVTDGAETEELINEDAIGHRDAPKI